MAKAPAWLVQSHATFGAQPLETFCGNYRQRQQHSRVKRYNVLPTLFELSFKVGIYKSGGLFAEVLWPPSSNGPAVKSIPRVGNGGGGGGAGADDTTPPSRGGS